MSHVRKRIAVVEVTNCVHFACITSTIHSFDYSFVFLRSSFVERQLASAWRCVWFVIRLLRMSLRRWMACTLIVAVSLLVRRRTKNRAPQIDIPLLFRHDCKLIARPGQNCWRYVLGLRINTAYSLEVPWGSVLCGRWNYFADARLNSTEKKHSWQILKAREWSFKTCSRLQEIV